MKTLMVVDHRVADFDAWKQVYDTAGDLQREGGVRSHKVLRSTEDPNRVVVTHVFDSREAARAFADLPELREAMGRAGVDASTVSIEYFDEVESGNL